MDWFDVAETVGKVAPLVGGALGGPAGAAVGGLAARLLGIEATPAALAQAVNDPETAHKLHQLELDHREALTRMTLEAETSRLAEVNRTMRAEAASNDPYVRRWRPTFGYMTAIAWGLQCLGIAISIVWKPESAGLVAQVITALTPMWSVALAMLGISVAKRSHDKQVAAGQQPPGGLMGAIATRVSGSTPR